MLPKLPIRQPNATYLLYTIAAIVGLGFSITVFARSGNSSSGIIYIKFPVLNARKVALSDSLETAAEGVTSLLNIGTFIDSAAAQATAAAASAIGSVGSQIVGALPMNISVGTREVCVGYSSRSECSLLPLKETDPLSQIGSQFPLLVLVASIFKHVPALETFLVVGTVFMGLSVLAGVFVVLKFPWALPCLLLLNSISLVFYSLSSIFAVAIYYVGAALSGVAGTVTERGEAVMGVFGAAIACLAALVLGLISIAF
ncbi:hypothetical protein F5Y16DRAFT_406930 [Xylariaceae sp. FL0255]|nr:hypothetical protein F5Y16DRAFT_406930 [Xylariaceae sp. FL0255]